MFFNVIMLSPPYHVSRIEDGAVSRNCPLLHIKHNLLREPLVADDQDRFCITLLVEPVR
jgi:hypothetical protein